MSGDQSVALLPLLTALAAVAALLSAALTAGLFAAFSIAVMPALNAEPPAVATATMRRINKVILRPTFFVAFFGGPLFAAVAALLSPRAAAVPFWVAASVLLLGSVLPTMARNVPLNRALDRGGADGGPMPFGDYVRAWTFWNDLRALAGLAAVAAIAVALTRGG